MSSMAARLPRLERVLGARPDEATADHVRHLIEDQVPEDTDLDYMSALRPAWIISAAGKTCARPPANSRTGCKEPSHARCRRSSRSARHGQVGLLAAWSRDLSAVSRKDSAA